jgi:hypothetical protein
LQGRGDIARDDQLVALQPIAATSAYTVYFTNASPTPAGLRADPVTQAGVQTLRPSAANPLILFNLKVSLEWDARADAKFLTELRLDLQRASELLYDWTNGQAALGELTIFHAKQHWADAHIRVYASNRLRPSANQGGVGESANQVSIGAIWNRFGDPSGNQGEDWPRALAHELGHYAFYLDDNYLGLDSNGHLISIDGCPGAMTDPYREDQGEFRPRADWLRDCAGTLANQTNGRADWETIVGAYPWLHAPSVPFAQINPGPSTLPLALTRIHFVEPDAQSVPLALPIFNLARQADGARAQTSDRARAFLFKSGGGDLSDLVDLGRPVLGQVLARGAQAGDRLCVFDPGSSQLGCTAVAAGNAQLALGLRADWQPQVILRPATARRIDVDVTGVGDLASRALMARLFPADRTSAPLVTTLVPEAGGYRGSFTLPDSVDPALEGYVQVWVDESGQRREIVTDYALGGNPAPPRRPRRRTRRRAPVMSTDGEVVLYSKDQDFQNGEFYAIQTATALPPPPLWASVVGHGYQLIASPNAPPLTGVSINIGYSASDLPSGTEAGVSVYFRNGMVWERLPTEHGADQSDATAQLKGPGLYVLMSSVEIPLQKGMNLLAYPVQDDRPVDEALASIAGAYTMVRGYDTPTRRWLVYLPGAPDYANTLKRLEFGKGYEIRVKQDVLLLLKGPERSETTNASGLTRATAQPFPPAPASYYGFVQAGSNFTPAPGQPVVAFVNGHVCGTGNTLKYAGRVVYTIDVGADGQEGAGCGSAGRTVTFRIGGLPMATRVTWDNTRPQELSLQP